MTIHPKPGQGLRIGVASTRLGTTDGVSLEAEKWCRVLGRLGHECFFFAGLCDRPAERSMIMPEAHFLHPAILQTYHAAFSHRERPPELTRQIHEIAQHLKDGLYSFVRQFDVQVLLVENALAIPLNIPLAMALTE